MYAFVVLFCTSVLSGTNAIFPSLFKCVTVGASITKFKAEDDDRDKNTNGKVQFFFDNAISNAADLQYFTLNKVTGVLYSAKPFDRETQAQFQVSPVCSGTDSDQRERVVYVCEIVSVYMCVYLCVCVYVWVGGWGVSKRDRQTGRQRERESVNVTCTVKCPVSKHSYSLQTFI